MPCKDLREFIALLEREGDLKRIATEVDPVLEITEISDRTLRANGPALLFENVKGSRMPLLANLFGHPRRVAMAMGQKDLQGLRDVGHLLAFLKEPTPPKGWKELWQNLPAYRQVLNIAPEVKKSAPCREVILDEDDIDLRTTAFVPQPGEWLPDFPIPDEERWIRVDLSAQTLIAYERDKPVRAFIISSGLPGTPTVTGEFRIRAKVRSQTMSGGSEELGTYYSLPNVQWVQYFYEDYGFHGSYWHNNFGNPMSHGCVNMTNADARWLFDWAGPEWDGRHWMSSTESNQGTLVIVHE